MEEICGISQMTQPSEHGGCWRSVPYLEPWTIYEYIDALIEISGLLKYVSRFNFCNCEHSTT